MRTWGGQTRPFCTQVACPCHSVWWTGLPDRDPPTLSETSDSDRSFCPVGSLPMVSVRVDPRHLTHFDRATQKSSQRIVQVGGAFTLRLVSWRLWHRVLDRPPTVAGRMKQRNYLLRSWDALFHRRDGNSLFEDWFWGSALFNEHPGRVSLENLSPTLKWNI
jgi:hypothetical protein